MSARSDSVIDAIRLTCSVLVVGIVAVANQFGLDVFNPWMQGIGGVAKGVNDWTHQTNPFVYILIVVTIVLFFILSNINTGDASKTYNAMNRQAPVYRPPKQPKEKVQKAPKQEKQPKQPAPQQTQDNTGGPQ
jgi:hypothetical protein